MLWKCTIFVLAFDLLRIVITATGQELLHRAYTDKYEISIYGHEYNYSQAKQKCINMNSRLIKIDSEDITIAIADMLSNLWAAWIGANDLTTEGEWRWIDGTEISRNYENWNSKEPNNWGGNEDCAIVDGRGGWNDMNCGRKFSFVCQKDLPKEFGDGVHRFYFNRQNEEKTNFFTAIGMCRTADSRLAEIHSEDVNQVIKAQLKKPNVFYWIGGNDLIEEGRWMWNNKTNVTNSGWGWKSGEPNGNNEDCLAISHDGWVDYGCNAPLAYICEKAGANTVTVSSARFWVRSSGPDEITCTAQGYPLPHFSWFQDEIRIPSLFSNSAYQTIEENGATLHTNQMTLLDEGEYTCRANNTVGNTSYASNSTSVIKVPSQPVTFAVKQHSCNSSLTISWAPNERAELVSHRIIVRDNNSDVVVINRAKTPYELVPIHHVTQNLSHWTSYNVTVTPCPSTCKTEYSVSQLVRTTGIPGKVSNITATVISPTSCHVTWTLPAAVEENAVTGHQITISEAIADTMENDTKSSTVSSGVVASYSLNGEPNRRYFFGVQAITCAGAGPIYSSEMSCVTEKQAPYIVPKATVHGSVSEAGEISMSVETPNQDNGTISCLFVIVQSDVVKQNYTLEHLTRVNISILENRTDDEYIAVALVVSRLHAEKTTVVLGNGSITECDITSTDYSARKKRSTSDNSTFVGTNMKLDPHKNYSIYIVSTTPSSGGVLFQVSDVQPLRGVIEENEVYRTTTGEIEVNEGHETTTFGNNDSNYMKNNSTIAIALVLVGCFLLVLFVVGLVLLKRRLNRKGTALERATESDQPAQTAQTPQQEETVIYQNAAFSSGEERSETDIRMEAFESTYQGMLMNDGAKFTDEFKVLTQDAQAKKGTTDVASKPEFKKKNRYRNILPFDVSRVIIRSNDTGYINACFIDGFEERNKFIASQGPLPSTVVDFWLMIVEQKSSVIIMLAKCVEAAKKKCEKYWPDHKSTAHFGTVSVTNKEEVRFCGFVRRTLNVTAEFEDESTEMTVYQYHFLTWPDHGVPATTSQLIRMHKEVMQTHQNLGESTPLIVHCSAGAGRTGTFVAYDILMNESKKMKSADVYNCVLKMREQRVEMVQNCDQYILVHKLTLESFLFGETDLTTTQATEKFTDIDYRMKIASEQFENLSRVEPLKITIKSSNTKISPYDRMKVVVPKVDGDNPQQTIDASFVESYDESSRLIASEGPTSSNVENFWRIVLDNSVSVIVSLEMEQERENKYWPMETGESVKFGPINVKLESGESANDFEKRTLTVKGFGRVVAMTHLQLLGGAKESCPTDGRQLIRLVDEMQKALRQSKTATALIHCRDGSGSTGTFCAIVNLVERLKVENRVDVFRGVKDLRDCRRGMVQTLDQYILCHQAVIDYLSSFDVYSNFR